MKRMKVKRVLMMLVIFASIAAQAQGYDDACQDMLRRIKKTYVERGEEDALRQLELLCGGCSESICKEARAWLREQKNKSRNNNTYNEQTFTVKGVEFKMIKVEGGTFSMGATSEQTNYENDEKPVHSVTLSDYYIGETEVTQELWQAVMGSNPSRFTGNNQRPVERVSWDDCQEFIKKLNQLTGKKFRLPTEAEWEYAARGGKHSRGYKYSGSNNADEVAWYWRNSGDKYLSGEWNDDRIIGNNCKTHPVKTKKDNELGLYDMSGNVWEWCNDWWGCYQSNSQTNPTGPSEGEYRVLRGGGWFHYDGVVRVSYRGYGTPDFRRSSIGLRLAL
ncbi:MAG: formylglycine-generating enzyme family protein [Candidatus Onthomorpha sp.]